MNLGDMNLGANIVADPISNERALPFRQLCVQANKNIINNRTDTINQQAEMRSWWRKVKYIEDTILFALKELQ